MGRHSNGFLAIGNKSKRKHKGTYLSSLQNGGDIAGSVKSAFLATMREIIQIYYEMTVLPLNA